MACIDFIISRLPVYGDVEILLAYCEALDWQFPAWSNGGCLNRLLSVEMLKWFQFYFRPNSSRKITWNQFHTSKILVTDYIVSVGFIQCHMLLRLWSWRPSLEEMHQQALLPLACAEKRWQYFRHHTDQTVISQSLQVSRLKSLKCFSRHILL